MRGPGPGSSTDGEKESYRFSEALFNGGGMSTLSDALIRDQMLSSEFDFEYSVQMVTRSVFMW